MKCETDKKIEAALAKALDEACAATQIAWWRQWIGRKPASDSFNAEIGLWDCTRAYVTYRLVSMGTGTDERFFKIEAPVGHENDAWIEACVSALKGVDASIYPDVQFFVVRSDGVALTPSEFAERGESPLFSK